MERAHRKIRGLMPLLALLASSVLATAQVPQLSITTSSNTSSPLLFLQDGNNDTGTSPLLQLLLGAKSSSIGMEVATQSQTMTGGAAPFSTIAPAGYGGLSLVQNGLASSANGGGQNSPNLAMCAQQLIGSGAGTSTSECWYFQVSGGGNTVNAPDVLRLLHTNPITNFTLLVPDGLNLAAATSTGGGGQLTISSEPSSTVDLSGKPVTIVGGFTTSNTIGPPSSKAGALQLFPGFLNSATPNNDPTVLEGPLQIGMAVKGNEADGLLACYTTTAQTATSCTDVKSPLLGVYFTVGMGSTHGSNGIITPPGRAVITSSGSDTWTAGTEICRDPGTPSEAAKALSGACPLGQAVGVAVGDSGSGTSHLVDLNFSPQGVGSSGYWSAGPVNNGGVTITVNPNGSEVAYGFYVTSEIASSTLILDVSAGDATADTYSFGIFNSTGAIVAYTPAQSFSMGPKIYTVSLFLPSSGLAGTVTLPPGKYYFGYTGTGALGTITLIPYSAFLIPFAQQIVLAAGTTGGTLMNFTPTADAWVSSGTTAAAFALAP